MAVRKILVFPDQRLRMKARSIDSFNEDLRQLAADMLETMYDAPGIGLAGPQIGCLRRIIVVDCAPKDASPEPRVFINPVILDQSEELFEWEEGCLSLPGQFAAIERPARITLSYKDLDGQGCEAVLADLWSICVQHEIDHLDGRLFIDKLSMVKRRMIERKLLKANRNLDQD